MDQIQNELRKEQDELREKRLRERRDIRKIMEFN